MQHSLSTEAKSLVQDSDDSSGLKEGLDEQFSAEPTKGDDQYDQEVESDTPATPTSIWSRIRKILLVLVAMWLALMILRGSGNKRPKVIHATRYSEDYKFRPAASPVITETLKDGRMRVRGAEPTARSVPSEKPKSKTRKRKSGKRREGKGGN